MRALAELSEPEMREELRYWREIMCADNDSAIIRRFMVTWSLGPQAASCLLTLYRAQGAFVPIDILAEAAAIDDAVKCVKPQMYKLRLVLGDEAVGCIRADHRGPVTKSGYWLRKEARDRVGELIADLED